MSKQIKKLLKVGDTVYSAHGGEEMTVTKIEDEGFETDVDYFRYDEVRKLYYLTKHGYERRSNDTQRKKRDRQMG